MIDFLQAIVQHSKNKHTELSTERAEVCKGCEFKKEGLIPIFLNSKIEEINGFECEKCGCPLATKIFAKDKKNICDKWKQ